MPSPSLTPEQRTLLNAIVNTEPPKESKNKSILFRMLERDDAASPNRLGDNPKYSSQLKEEIANLFVGGQAKYFSDGAWVAQFKKTMEAEILSGSISEPAQGQKRFDFYFKKFKDEFDNAVPELTACKDSKMIASKLNAIIQRSFQLNQDLETKYDASKQKIFVAKTSASEEVKPGTKSTKVEIDEFYTLPEVQSVLETLMGVDAKEMIDTVNSVLNKGAESHPFVDLVSKTIACLNDSPPQKGTLVEHILLRKNLYDACRMYIKDIEDPDVCFDIFLSQLKGLHLTTKKHVFLGDENRGQFSDRIRSIMHMASSHWETMKDEKPNQEMIEKIKNIQSKLEKTPRVLHDEDSGPGPKKIF